MPPHIPSLLTRKFKRQRRAPPPTRTQGSSAAADIVASETHSSSTTDRTPVAAQSARAESTSTPSDTTGSPAGSAAVNALKLVLQHLGEAPLPGIKIATIAILDVINRIQNLGVVDKKCKTLTSRMESLWYLLRNIGEIDGSSRYVQQLKEELQQLAYDLESASRQNKVEAFFNGGDDISSLDSHNESLNIIITDLTFALSKATNREILQIRADIAQAVKQLHAGDPSAGVSGGMRIDISNNEISEVRQNFGANNKTYGGNARMDIIARNNKIGFIGGDAFSGNVVSTSSR